MTTFRLLRALTRTMQKCEWRLQGTTIRAWFKDYAACPLTFVEKIATGRRTVRRLYETDEAGEGLGIPHELTAAIAYAADSIIFLTSKEVKLRRILLKAARLK